MIILGAGTSGLIASINATRNGKKVLIIEKMPKIGLKLKATGGGRCNLTNTLNQEIFMQKFGKNGRFMSEALNSLSSQNLCQFFKSIEVDTHSPDGFRIFPITHSSNTILDAFTKELEKLNVEVICGVNIEKIEKKEEFILSTKNKVFKSKYLIIATGGLGYPNLGSSGDGYVFAKNFGHTVTKLYPAMMPLYTKEKWVEHCKADTIANATIKVDLPKFNKLKASGDLIFTKDGIRGPVVLDFAREITPFLDELKEVPILINLTKGLNEEQILQHIKTKITENPTEQIVNILSSLLPKSVAIQFCNILQIEHNITFKRIDGIKKEKLIKYLSWTPFHIVGHGGFKNAMITRGGVSLKQIDPKTMQSKLVPNLYFCGEIVDLDGPCGGYNLQWAFSSGFLAGKLLN